MDLSPEDEEPCVKAGHPLVTPTYGPKQHVFVDNKAANDDRAIDTGITADSKGYSLNCLISVSGVDTADLLGDIGYQLPLPFNVHVIDRSLSLAPNGKWSHLDYVLNNEELLDTFLVDLKFYLGRKRFRKKLYFDAINMLLANLFEAHYSSSQLLLDRDRRKHPNSNPAGIDNRTIASVTDYLADRGLIDLHIGRRNSTDKNSSWCIPLAPLIGIIDRADAKTRLHSKTQFAVVRDGDKNAIPMYTNKNKRLALIRYGRTVEQYYQTWLSHTAMLDGRYLLPWLKRLFNWNMDLGGRFYGHYQQIPSVDRKRILIDGEKTVELDYKSVHIALLYALEGLPVHADPYVIDGHSDKRQTFKSIILRLVNSEDLASFKANITRSGNPDVKEAFKTYTNKRQQYEYLRSLRLKAIEPSKPLSIKRGFINDIPYKANGDELLSLIMDRHQPIAHHFGTKNIGLKLQKLDSELIANALNKLQDIPCLPVHDSIRCKVSDMELVSNAMIESFRELHGQEIMVTNDLSDKKD